MCEEAVLLARCGSMASYSARLLLNRFYQLQMLAAYNKTYCAILLCVVWVGEASKADNRSSPKRGTFPGLGLLLATPPVL